MSEHNRHNYGHNLSQKRLVRKLVDRLIYSGGGLHVLYVMAVDNAATVLEKKMNVASEILSEAISKTKNVLEILKNGTTDIQHVAGASVVVSGGACAKVIELPMNVKRSHLVQWKREMINIDQKKLATLHNSEGWTIKKLAEHFKISQSSIKIHLYGLDRGGRKKAES